MIPFSAKTHPGLRRAKNEDNLAFDAELGLWIVADGVGGHSSGEVASAIACDVIRSDVAQGQSLTAAIEHAHQAVLAEIAALDVSDLERTPSEPEYGRVNNMGTTVVALRIEGSRYEIAWVGDSRVYAYDGTLQQLTRDHSAVNDLIDQGVISAEQASQHPQRHALSRSLGVSNDNASQASSVTGKMQQGCQFILCTDGLTDELTDAAILHALRGNESPESQVNALIDSALAHGGSDNITIVIVGEPKATHTKDKPAKRHSRRTSPSLETTQELYATSSSAQVSNAAKFFWAAIALAAIVTVVMFTTKG